MATQVTERTTFMTYFISDYREYLIILDQLRNQSKMDATSKSVDQSTTNESSQQKNEQMNKTIRKDVEKIVDKYDIEDVATQCDAAQNKTVSYCRCWKSKKFPLCDGSHNAWNKETGDNVGPLVITKKQ